MSDTLVTTLQELIAIEGTAMDVRTAVARLMERGYPSDEYVTQAVKRSLTADVREAFRANDPAGRPYFRMRSPEDASDPPLHIQLDLSDEDDWRYTLDVKAKGIRDDWARYEREVDIFESLFGYRYRSPHLPDMERPVGVEYGDETAEDDYR